MTTHPLPLSHPVSAVVARVEAELESVSDVPLWSMSAADSGDVLVALAAARARLDELTTRVLRQGEAVGTGLDSGGATTTAWFAHETCTTRLEATRLRRLGEALERHEHVRSALASGSLVTDQARVIVDAVDALPAGVESWVPERATEFLLQQARHHDAKALRVLGRRVLEVVDPDVADAEEARRLEVEERDALAAASFSMREDGHGKVHGRFTLPALAGEMLRTHLLALVSPRRAPAESPQAEPSGSSVRRR